MTLSRKQCDKIILLRREKNTFPVIAEKVGCSVSSAKKVWRRHNVASQPDQVEKTVHDKPAGISAENVYVEDEPGVSSSSLKDVIDNIYDEISRADDELTKRFVNNDKALSKEIKSLTETFREVLKTISELAEITEANFANLYNLTHQRCPQCGGIQCFNVCCSACGNQSLVGPQKTIDNMERRRHLQVECPV